MSVRPVEEWDLSDLEALIANGVQESLHLDYKASAALSTEKKADISKDVSALANSDGGIIVYGIAEKDGEPNRIDAGSDLKKFNKDWLEQVISSNISPRIQGVRIRQIAVGEGRAVFALSVPKTESGGPHQANDQRYYRRFEARSVPMQDYEIRDVMGRVGRPHLKLELRLRSNIFEGGLYRVLFEAHIHSASIEPILYSNCALFVGEAASHTVSGFQTDGWQNARDQPGNRFKFQRYRRDVVVPNDAPIYRERPLHAGNIVFNLQQQEQALIHYVLTAPGFRVEQTAVIWASGMGTAHLAWIEDEHQRLALITEGESY